jgi:hypothetical protein
VSYHYSQILVAIPSMEYPVSTEVGHPLLHSSTHVCDISEDRLKQRATHACLHAWHGIATHLDIRH